MENTWKNAVIAELIVAGIYREEHEGNARKALHELICYEVAIALDPLVSQSARNLQGRARREALEAAAQTFMDRVDAHQYPVYGAYDALKAALEIPLDTEEE